ncbi:MAG: precorrin-6y C5,15-methyltransferase (decarboxylating) subunit CbiE [Devosia sp.]
MTAWLEIVGVGESEMPVLPSAEDIIGPKRLLDRLPAGHRLEPWRSPKLDLMLEQVMAHRGRPTVILASGDPMWFGIGATLARHLDAGEFRVHPHVSSFQLAAARLGWPLQHVTTLSLHGRPAELIQPHVAPGVRILALTTGAETPGYVARLLVARGYGRTRLTVLDNLSAPDERVQSAQAVGYGLTAGPFHVLAIDCVADAGAPLLAAVPGLPDEAFVTDGQLTKREVRAVSLARLSPYPGALLWDVGAGCGSIGIEWMRAARDTSALAFEREGERLQMIAVNAERLGVPTLQIVPGEVPDTLVGKPVPDAIFVGGGVADEPLFHACWTALRPGGRLVANAVTLDGEAALQARQSRLGGDLVRIEVSALDSIGAQRVMRPRMAVTQWAVSKP